MKLSSARIGSFNLMRWVRKRLVLTANTKFGDVNKKTEPPGISRTSKAAMEVIHVRNYWSNGQYWKGSGRAAAGAREKGKSDRQDRRSFAASGGQGSRAIFG